MDTNETNAASENQRQAATCATSSGPGCSAPNCPICDMPFEYGDIRIGEKDGIQFCYYCAARAAELFETLDAVIGKVTPCAAGWNVAFAPDCTTWVTVRRDEHAEPKVGNFITVTVPKVVQIHSQPNPTGQAAAHGTEE